MPTLRTQKTTAVAALLLFASVGTALSQSKSGMDQLPHNPKWAVLVGINYTNRKGELGELEPLRNAARDAEELSRVLQDYYGYQEQNIVLLTDAEGSKVQPNESEIRKQLGNLRLKVRKGDSLLVFFAGHAARRDGDIGEQVALLPLDVKFDGDGDPVQSISLPDGLFKMINEFKCKDKLIILDCCFSGEIFSATGRFQFQPPSGRDNGDRTRQATSSFQAIASSRATQKAADAPNGGGLNSKFTTNLLAGLRHLPRSNQKRVWANRLLDYISDDPDFDESQRPDCRNLNGYDGEFCFEVTDVGWNKLEGERARQLGGPRLKAMVASCQGNWWFNEMPWFIPSIRTELMQIHQDATPRNRSAGFSSIVDLAQLRSTAENFLRNRTGETLATKHASMLLRVANKKDQNRVLQTIETELEEEDERRKKEDEGSVGIRATDLHLLAVVKHILGKDDAEATYRRAMDRHSKETERTDLPLIAALCIADYGEFLRSTGRHADAAKQFRNARSRATKALRGREGLEKEASAFFSIFALTREADALSELNSWRPANELLDRAISQAQDLAKDHYLLAHVYSRRAWSETKQWKLSAAKSHFDLSNKILLSRFHEDSPPPRTGLAPRTGDSHPGAELVANSLKAFHSAEDHASKIRFLHNMHGIAMAIRFEGQTQEAAMRYRELDSLVEESRGRFLSLGSFDAGDPAIAQDFVTRLVNTRERLGDCNLFGDPDLRNPKEAFDDYRRALSLVHLLGTPSKEDERDAARASTRAKMEALLTYKQAISLALPSSVQDTRLACQMCKSADATYASQGGASQSTGGWQALGELATKVVEALDAKDSGPLATKSNSPIANAVLQEAGDPKSNELRAAILKYRDIIGSTPHRDQLEMCLFASKVLLECTTSRNSYQTLRDCELLHSFCRMALSRYTPIASSKAQSSETRKYLRPYYDAIVRSRLRQIRSAQGDSVRVKDLIEFQAEASLGVPYAKPTVESPILAVYEVDNEVYLFTDVPYSASRCDRVTEFYDLESIRAAMAGKELLPLPRQIRDHVVTWRNEHPDTRIQFRPAQRVEASKEGVFVTANKPVFDLDATGTPRIIRPENLTVPKGDEKRPRFPFKDPFDIAP